MYMLVSVRKPPPLYITFDVQYVVMLFEKEKGISNTNVSGKSGK